MQADVVGHVVRKCAGERLLARQLRHHGLVLLIVGVQWRQEQHGHRGRRGQYQPEPGAQRAGVEPSQARCRPGQHDQRHPETAIVGYTGPGSRWQRDGQAKQEKCSGNR